MELWIESARNEFHWLCNKIVTDGRDPYVVAEAMLEKLVRHNREYETLWEARCISSANR